MAQKMSKRDVDGMDRHQKALELMDYLTCGQCFKEFPLKMITTFIIHKKFDCNDQITQIHSNDADLQCSACPRGFMTAWGLLNHVQENHNIRLFITKGNYYEQNETGSSVSHLQNSKADVGGDTSSIILKDPVLDVHSDGVMSKTSELQKSHECVHKVQLQRDNNQLSVPEIADHILYSTPGHENSTKVSEPAFDAKSISPGSGKMFHTAASVVPTESQTLECSEELHSSNLIPNITTQAGIENPNIAQIKNPNNSVLEESAHQKGLPEIEEKGESVYKTLKPLCDKTDDGNNSSPNSSENILQDVQSSVEGKTFEEKSDSDPKPCCDNQKCGITVIPVTHEKLKECCNAVVPKKRKRHFETKHIPFSWASRYGKRRISLTNIENKSASAGTIYIDVQSNTGEMSSNIVTSPINSGNTTDSEHPRGVDDQKYDSELGVISHSVILKPGAVFSIPFPCPTSSQENIPKHSQLTQNNVTSTPSATIHTDLTSKLVKNNSQNTTTRMDLKKPNSIPVSSILSATFSPSEFNRPTPSRSLPSVQGKMASTQISTEGYGQSIIIRSESMDDTFIDEDMKGLRKRRYPTSRPYKCEQCDNAFNQRIHLKKHMSKHTGIKPYKCQQCDYSTVERSHLKVHIRIHTGEKPFKCTYCEYATAQNSTLKIHLKRHHSGKVLECQLCAKKFDHTELLQVHEMEEHQADDQNSSSSMSSKPVSPKSASGPADQSIFVPPVIEITRADLVTTDTIITKESGVGSGDCSNDAGVATEKQQSISKQEIVRESEDVTTGSISSGQTPNQDTSTLTEQ
ncbi:hypothetical protein ScPMuIL_001424 [Solemya velum]